MKRRTRPKGTWMKLRSATLLREMMKTRGASNADVARAAGCGRTFISALLNGRRSSCSPTLADKIALFFGVPTEALFEERASAVSGQNIMARAS